jgi:hypothetical protein
MTKLTPHVFNGEVITPGETVKVIGRPKPLQAKAIKVDLPCGHTVNELLDLALGDQRSSLVQEYAVYVDGVPVPPEWRSRVRLRAGRCMTFEPRLKGNAGRSIALIAVAVLALVVSIFLPPLLVASYGLLATTASLISGLVATGIVVAGTLAVNALFPIPPQQQLTSATQQAKQAFSISGTRNSADPYGTITAVLGRIRTFPKYAALPYTSFEGQDQYLRCLFCVGYGPLAISDLKIGETNIDDFDDVLYDVLEGYSSDNDPDYYTNQAEEESLSIALTNAASWQTRTTASDIDEISLDFSMPQGWYKVDESTGKYQKRQVTVDAEYAVAGSGTWVTLGTFSRQLKRLQPWRFGLSLQVTRGPAYDVRVRKSSGDLDSSQSGVDNLNWSIIRVFRYDKTITFRKPLALVAMKIKATDQLNSVIDSFNCIAQSRVTAFDGAGHWVPDTESTNPADLFRWVLQGPVIYSAVSDEQIDLDSLEAWWQYCADEGWEYNKDHDQRATVFDQLRTIAAAGRGRVTRTDGKWGVIWDDANIPVAQHFTPRNSWGFQEVRTYFTPPHAIRTPFKNAAKSWAVDELTTYADGYDSSNASVFESWEFPGQTDQDKIWRLVRFQLAQAELRPSVYTLNTNWQALSCTVGDRVYVSHDASEWGLQAARVLEVHGDDLTLDEEITFELGFEYQLRFRTSANETVLRSVATPPATGATFSLSLVSDGMLPSPEVGDLVMFGEDVEGPAALLRVRDIEWQADYRARVTLVDDAPGIADADTGAIPAYDSGITAPTNLFLRPPSGLTVQEVTYVENSIGKSKATIAWNQTPYRVNGFELEMRDDNITPTDYVHEETLSSTTLTTNIYDIEPGTYSFRVRTIFDDGSPSNWTYKNSITFVGYDNPDTPTTFRIAILADVATLSWDQNKTQAINYYTIKYSPVTDGTASWATSTVLVAQATGTHVQVPSLNGTYLIKAVNTDDVESVDPATIITLSSGLRYLNVVETTDPAPHWLGTLTNLTVDTAMDLVLTPTGSGTNEGLYEFYYAENIDLGEVFTSRINATIMAFGSSLSSFMSSWVTLASVDNISGASASDWAVTLEERHTNDDPNSSPVEWSDWAELIVGDVTARAFEFRIYLFSFNPDIQTVVESVEIHVDMPDRIDSFGDVTVPVTGYSLTFSPPFRHLETVQITAIQDAVAGDHPIKSGQSESGVTVYVYDDTEHPVQRVVDIVAVGYGRKVT